MSTSKSLFLVVLLLLGPWLPQLAAQDPQRHQPDRCDRFIVKGLELGLSLEAVSTGRELAPMTNLDGTPMRQSELFGVQYSFREIDDRIYTHWVTLARRDGTMKLVSFLIDLNLKGQTPREVIETLSSHWGERSQRDVYFDGHPHKRIFGDAPAHNWVDEDCDVAIRLVAYTGTDLGEDDPGISVHVSSIHQLEVLEELVARHEALFGKSRSPALDD